MAKPKYHTNLVGHKVCSRCAKAKPFAEFYPLRSNNKNGRSDGRQSSCIECERQREANKSIEYKRQHYEKNRKRYLQQRRDSTYGLYPGQYDEMLAAQGNKCAICERPERRLNKRGEIRQLGVDHCHETGKVRALLCNACNHALGSFEDSVQMLQAAIAYLEKHR